MLRWHVISGVFQRNVKQYFTSVIGYLFIVVFVTLCAILTFSPQFFADNLANLDQLSRYFPWLLLFIIPAITMNVWAEERKQGTDALLFTLPASDLEIMLGKFFAVTAVYTVALLFSLTQVIALRALGNPDLGVVFSTYFGYWLAGLALLSIGMFASSLTSSSTIAFIIGAALCAVPVATGYYFGGIRFFEIMSIPFNLRDFTVGLISFPAVIYFVSIILFMLYLNLVVITKRHWSRGQSISLGGHFAVRIATLAIALVAINIICDRASAWFPTRMDLTAERLYTLDKTTRTTIKNAKKAKRPVTIQAFVSTNVPREYVNTRKNFIGLLRQYDRIGGNNLEVRFVDVAPASKHIKEAKSHELKPKVVEETIGGKSVTQDFFMGAVVTSSLGDKVLPFVDSDTSLEYELTRAIAATTDESRKITVGVLETDYRFAYFHYLNPETGLDEPYNWGFSKTYDMLERQYDVSTINSAELSEFADELKPKDGRKAEGSEEEDQPADEEAEENESASDKSEEETIEFPDVLLVVDPSSLPNESMFDLITYIESGRPVMILADPLPYYWISLQPSMPVGLINAPSQPRINAGWNVTTISPEPKSNLGRSVIDVEQSDCSIKTTVQFGAPVGNTIACIFRYRDDSNFWSLRLNDFGEFQLVKRRAGNEEVVETRAIPSFDERVPVDIEVTLNGDSITWGSGMVKAETIDQFNADATRYGVDLRSDGVALQSFEISKLKKDESPLLPANQMQAASDDDTIYSGVLGGQCALLCERLGIDWIYDRAAWQQYNPHPGFKPYIAAMGSEQWPEEYGPKRNLFLFTSSFADHVAFNKEDEISKGLKEVLFMYPGTISARKNNNDLVITPLITLKPEESGVSSINELTKNEIVRQINRMTGESAERPLDSPLTGSEFRAMKADPTGLERSDIAHHLAARIRGEKINVVFIADTDFLCDFYHQQIENVDQMLDNYTLLANCIESLAGNSTFVNLRNRRPDPRTLSQFEIITEQFRKDRAKKDEEAEADRKLKLDAAQKRLDKAQEELAGDEELSILQKMTSAEMKSSSEQVRYNNEVKKLDADLKELQENIRISEQQNIANMESFVRFLVIILAPIPALVLGLTVFLIRLAGESKLISPERRVA